MQKQNIKDVPLVFTEKMKKLSVELIKVKFSLDNDNLSITERNSLNKRFNQLLKEFRTELNQNNPSEMEMLKKYFQDNNEIDK